MIHLSFGIWFLELIMIRINRFFSVALDMAINKKWMDILIVCVFSLGLLGWFHSLIDTEVLSW